MVEAFRRTDRPGRRAIWVGIGYLIVVWGLAALALASPLFRGLAIRLIPGLNLALLLGVGIRWLPLTIIGPAIGAVLFTADEVGLLPVLVWVSTVAAATGAGAALLRHGLRIDPRLSRLRDVEGLVLGAILIPVPIAAAGSLASAVSGSLPWPAVVDQAIHWWVGDAIGLLILAPFLLVHVIARLSPWLAGARPRVSVPGVPVFRGGSGPAAIEGLLQTAAVAAAVVIPYGTFIGRHTDVAYVGFIPLAWIALRRGLPGATTAAFALTLGTVLAARVLGAPAKGLAELQILTLAFALTGLFLGAVVSERRRTEAALRASEGRLRALFEHARDALVIVDDEGRVQDTNPAASTLLGRPLRELVGRSITALADPAHAADLAQGWGALLRTGELVGRTRVARPDGTLRDVDYGGTARFLPGRHLLVLRDVTERRALEEELRLAQKMEVVGRLAGGVAHEFNNLLAVVLGYAETLSVELDDPWRHDAREIQVAAQRAAELTRQLLAFSRRQALAPILLDLNTLLGEMDAVIRRLLGDDKTLVLLRSRPLGRVRADPGQLTQVVLNMALNARDAMPAGGTLMLETADRRLEAGSIRPGWPPEAGDFVTLTVRDTGAGIRPEVQVHLFEPFFTTREVGQGTGLGLAAAHGIIRQHDGQITVDSKLGRGTTFVLFLPRAELPMVETATRSGTPREGSETILLVEDDSVLREGVRLGLVELGYTVLDAAHGDEARLVADAYEGPVDLLLTDVILPGLTGPALAERLRRGRPRLRVVYLSGYGPDAAPGDGPFLAKPFTIAALARAVRAALDAPEPGAPGSGRARGVLAG